MIKTRIASLKKILTEEEFAAFISGDRVTYKKLLKKKNVPV